ncbi:hypothetical protein MUO79_01280 [Candidatus Bathyarchaeota archaeon]|nr:hypothetical protein [Candidatus Bathyarchaeota archaeon]
MEPQQVLKIKVKVGHSFGNEETFYARMNRDGRIVIPKLTLELLTNEDEESLVGPVFGAKLEPAEGPPEEGSIETREKKEFFFCTIFHAEGSGLTLQPRLYCVH